MKYKCMTTALALLFLGACNSPEAVKPPKQGFPVKFLVGSALEQFCNQAADQFNQTQPKLDNGTTFYLQCEAKGSGDVVQEMVTLAEQFQGGTIPPNSSEFPTLLSVDGEIYHSQLIYHINNRFPGQNYIPQITDAPLLAHSPMVFMAAADLAPGLRQQEDLYQALVGAENHQDLDPNSPQLPINFVHTAPSHSNSGLQTLVAQFASVSGKAPEKMTIAEVRQYQGEVQSIQSKVTRYGTSTGSLARDMVKNGPYWATIASVYESSVIAANSNSQGNDKYEAIYPKTTFTSNMRGILPTAPWVSKEERAAAEQFLAYLRTPEVQQIATAAGLRPGVPGVSLSSKFSPQFGVDPKAKYSSLRPSRPEVVAAMIQSWQEFAKKPSLVVVVVDSSGSMGGNKLPAVQSTLRNYITNLGPQENIALIDFDSEIRPPILADGTGAGQNQGLQ
ncbi:MAG: VWA domain-containing protein, partial [Prochloron sp. SP5CPC1]|nr:VWA domain-containing protein [Candidatus Paraprochloron terpiosi SP5CPC1]